MIVTRLGPKFRRFLESTIILMPLALRSNRGHGNGTPKPIPAGHEQHHVQATGLGRELTLARHQAQGMLLAPLGFVRRVANERKLAIGRWRQGPHHLLGHAAHYGVGVPRLGSPVRPGPVGRRGLVEAMLPRNFVYRPAGANPARPRVSPPEPVASLAPFLETGSAKRRHANRWAMGMRPRNL
jgi:hypothetical protein